MRRLLKFLHTLGAAGYMGGGAALAVVMILAPSSIGSGDHLPVIRLMAKVATWIIAPSMVLTVLSGLLSMAATPGFQNAGWVWVKTATGIIVLLGGLHVLGPIQDEVKRSAGALADPPDAASLASLFASEANTLWVLLAVSVANIALGVWRPRMPKIRV